MTRRNSKSIDTPSNGPPTKPCTVILELLTSKFIEDAINGRINWDAYFGKSQSKSKKRGKIKRKKGNAKRVLSSVEKSRASANDPMSSSMSDEDDNDSDFKFDPTECTSRGPRTRSKYRLRRQSSSSDDFMEDFEVPDPDLSADLSKIYNCDKCAFKTNRHNNLIMHSAVHKNICFICKLQLNSLAEVENHMVSSHNPVIENLIYYSCARCITLFRTQSETKEHVLLHLERSVVQDGIYLCLFCRNTFTKEISLVNHMHKNHILYRCTFCEKLSTNFDTLERHCQALHPYYGKPFACNLCDLTFAVFGSLTVHRRDYHALEWHEGQDKCRICFQLLHTRDEVLGHLAAHVNMSVYKCYMCKFTTNRENEILQHCREQHSIPEIFANIKSVDEIMHQVQLLIKERTQKKEQETRKPRCRPTPKETESAVAAIIENEETTEDIDTTAFITIDAATPNNVQLNESDSTDIETNSLPGVSDNGVNMEDEDTGSTVIVSEGANIESDYKSLKQDTECDTDNSATECSDNDCNGILSEESKKTASVMNRCNASPKNGTIGPVAVMRVESGTGQLFVNGGIPVVDELGNFVFVSDQFLKDSDKSTAN